MQIVPGPQGGRVYSPEGVSCTLAAQSGGFGGKTGLYEVGLPIREDTRKGYKTAYPGDSISLAFPGEPRRGRVGKGIAHTLATGGDQGTLEVYPVKKPLVKEPERNASRMRPPNSPMFTLTTKDRHGVFLEDTTCTVLTPERETIRQNGRRIKSAEEPMFTLTAQDRHGILHQGRIRRLTPRECLRLQGWEDERIDRVLPIQSDNQIYKQAGNGVTVTVVEAIGKRLAAADKEMEMMQTST